MAIVKLPRRILLHLAASVAALSAVSRIVRAQTYPTRPVRIVVGFTVGGKAAEWPAPGSEDTELGVLMEPEVSHGETEVYAGVQA
jgi:hypothetical protein